MTINFTIAEKGVRYNCGHIHQTLINGHLRFVLIPSFKASPPFAFTMLKGAQNRMTALALMALEAGIKVPKENELIYNGVEQYSY